MTSKATKTGSELEQRVADAYRQIGVWRVEPDVELADNQVDVCRTEGLDARILQVLYSYLQEHPGDPKAHLHELIGALGAQRADVIPYLLGLQEKGWLYYDLTERAESGLVWLTQQGIRVARDARPEPALDAAIHRPELEVYASYAAGLHRLLEHLGPEHPHYLDALAHQQRLNENIELTQSFGDTDTRKAERSEVISRLNALALSTVGIPFNELCEHDLPPPPSPDVPATVFVPAGPFWMGSLPEDTEAHENEKPRRRCELEGYWIGRYPVTNAQYACFLAANPQYPVPHTDEENASPCNWDPQARTYPGDKADHPVVLVNWEDAETYCRWLSQITGKHYRLPTEQEWEKAARGDFPDTRRYPWGNDWQPGYCNARESGRDGTTSVHEFEQINRSPSGVVDMAGNVWEWTASWYEGYPDSLHKSVYYGRLCLVVRGGSWRNSRRGARLSCRGRCQPPKRCLHMGFRIASD
jgi:iron(II)-dependent oxidoreductase